MKSRALAIAALVLLAGCGGGGSSPATGPVQTPQNPTQSPQQNSINLTVSFPVGGSKTSSSQRTPKYVSPGSTKIEVIVNSVTNNGVTSAPPSWVATDQTTTLNFGAGGNCTVTGGTATCTIPIAAPVGTVNYTINAEDGSNNILATTTTSIPISQGVNNTTTVTLHGVVKTVTLSGAALAANDQSHNGAGGNTPETLTVSAFDASTNQIVNGTSSANYNNPITLTDNDATGQTKLILNGGTPASSVVVSNPSDVVTLQYTGQAANTFTITASGTGISGGGTITTTVNDITFPAGTTDDDTAHGGLAGDPNYGQQTVFFSAPSGSQNITAAELGFTNSPFNQQFTITLSAGCSGIAATSPASPGANTTFTIVASGNTGICSGKVSETGTGYPITQHAANTSGSETHDGTFWISVTSANFTINGKRHQTQ